MLKHKFLIASSLVIITMSISAQNNLKFENSFLLDSILFTWKPGQEINGKVMKRFFPSYFTYLPHKDTVLKSDLFEEKEIFKAHKTMLGVQVQSNVILYQKKQDTLSKFIPKERLFLQLEIFSNHIDSIDVWYELKEFKKWYNAGKIKLIKKQTYQPIITINIELDSLIKRYKDISKLTINAIKIFGLTNKNQKPELLFGEVTIVQTHISKYIVDYNSTSIYHINWRPNELKVPSVLVSLPDVIERYGQRPKVKLLMNDKLSETEKVKYVSGYIHQIFTNYPHYSLKGLNKDSILNKHLQISSKTDNLTSYYQQIEKVVASFHDLHFHITNMKKKNENLSLTPLYFSMINGEVQVVGIFDTTLRKKISLGDQLIEINHKPINNILQELKSEIIASTDKGFNKKITQQLLSLSFKYFHKNLELKFSDKNISPLILDSVSIFRNKNIYVPENFKPTNGLSYSKIKDISYIRIGEFREELFNPFIYSFIDSIKLTKGIVFDVRNNFSGDHSIATIVSLFIKTITPILQTPIENIDPFNSLDGYYTVLVKPSYYYCPKPIVFLVDSRTTCAAELLISDLKKIKENVWIIGETPTASGAELACTTTLPESNGFSGYLVYYSNIQYNGFNDNIDKNGGLLPDIRVSINSYKDLAPFDDKILSKAIIFLEDYLKYQKTSYGN